MKSKFSFLFIILLSAFLFTACDPSNLNYLLFDTPRSLELGEVNEVDSIFTGYSIFIGQARDRHRRHAYDLRYNQRYLEFNHNIFSAFDIRDKDIINWAFNYLRYSNSRYWAVINLDNKNQIVIHLTNSPHAFRDIAIISYRQQESDAMIQSTIDWWDIATATISINDTTISWEGFVETETGELIIRQLEQSPFK